MTNFVECKKKIPNLKSKLSSPNVWEIVEGRKKTNDGKILRFSIQEIPENRFNEVLDHFVKIFARDETLLSSFDAINDEAAIEDLKKLWRHCLQNGQTVGAFVMDDDGKKTALAGVNMTLVSNGPDDLNFMTFTSKACKTVYVDLVDYLESKYNTRKHYNVEKFLMACGLVVDPLYRRRGVAFHLLHAREKMSKAYDVRATSTIFSSLAAQKTAEQAGFETITEQKCSEIVDSVGNKLFPNLTTNLKFMGKRF